MGHSRGMPTTNSQNSPQAAIETRGLTKRFGERTAIDRVDLYVPSGSAFGFLGPSGAEKTTMIGTLLGRTSERGQHVAARPPGAARAGAGARASGRDRRGAALS